ncbi:MAG TPA: MBL fold metallo-hydrolase [Xanthobacteraceae bacterium]|jgi:ribonuclease BN (tRNA processing enzyme)
MRITIVGSGDAFGSGGRFNSCFWIETAKAILLVDCGASSPVALKQSGLDFDRVDAVVLSHLHGDHFGGLPFLLLDAQLVSKRERPLVISGPPGTQARLEAALEVFFPRATTNRWRFPLEFTEIAPGYPAQILGHSVTTAEVVHQSGAPSTALRISDGRKQFAYSGDTEWTGALVPIAHGADLFLLECSGYAGRVSGHLTWDVLKGRLADLAAHRIMITHMSEAMLAHRDELESAGLLVAKDGAVIEL